MKNRDRSRPAGHEGAEPIRTLVVDDAPEWLNTICLFLESAPAITVVGTARDGLQALALVEALRPELVMLDVRMPRMHGLDAVALLRACFPEVRILMMSAEDDAETRDACLATGAHAFVPKCAAATALLPAIFGLFGGAGTAAPAVPGTAQLQPA